MIPTGDSHLAIQPIKNTKNTKICMLSFEESNTKQSTSQSQLQCLCPNLGTYIILNTVPTYISLY